MLQDSIVAKQRHDTFVKKICEKELVYGLENKDGFATSESVQFEEDGIPVELICFWSELDRARLCMKEGWEGYEIKEMSLSEFMGSWCVKMHNDGIMVGTEFDENLFGYEIEPLDLVLEIISELKRLGKKIHLEKFKDLDDLEAQVKEVMS